MLLCVTPGPARPIFEDGTKRGPNRLKSLGRAGKNAGRLALSRFRPLSRFGGDELARRRQDHRSESRGAERRRPPFRRDGAVERGPLFRLAAKRADQVLHGLGRKLLSVLRAGGARDALVHQGAAEIVRAGLKTRRRALRPHLDPGGLDVRDMGMKREPRDRMHQHRFPESGPAPRRALEIHRRLHMHEGQRHEFR